MKFSILSLVVVSLISLPAFAQQVQIQTPFTTLQDSFFERVGVNFGFALPGTANFRGGQPRGVVGLLPNGQVNPTGQLVFSQNSAASAVPQFGGYDPGADAQFGFRKYKDGGYIDLNLFGGKGNSRTLVNQTPSVIVPNGFSGSISDTVSQPFVTSIIPVVGMGTGTPVRYVSPLDIALQRLAEQGRTLESLKLEIAEEERLEAQQRPKPVRTFTSEPSSATQGALSVAEIKRQRAEQKQEQSREVQALLQKVDYYESEGRFGTARVYLNQAIRKSSGNARQQLEARYQELKTKR